MTPTEAYDVAVTMLGPEAGCWASTEGNCFVGRWTSLATLDPLGRAILKTTSRGLQIFGSGSTWAAALADAVFRLRPPESALETERANREGWKERGCVKI